MHGDTLREDALSLQPEKTPGRTEIYLTIAATMAAAAAVKGIDDEQAAISTTDHLVAQH
jgi:hypothetical protein